MSVNIKNFVETKFFSREAIMKTLQNYEKMVTSNYVIYHKSFGSYCQDKKTSNKRMFFYWFFWILNLFHLIEFFICLKSPNESTRTNVGFPIMVFTNQIQMIYMAEFLTTLFVLFGKMNVLKLEHNRRFHILTLLNYWQTNPDLFDLNPVNTKKLIVRSVFVFWAVKWTRTFIIGITDCFIIYYAIIAYMYHNFHLVDLIVHTMALLIWIANTVNFAYICLFCVFAPITMLNYKFDEILKSLRINIRWNNTNKTMEFIEQHQQTTQLLNDLAVLYSTILGTIYIVLPYIMSVAIKLFVMPGFNLFLRLIMICIFVSNIIFIYLFNYIFASITVRNRDAPKYLYFYFFRSTKLRITTRLKIEEFLVRLNNEFIGVYCLNMFKFTKMSFYQYFMSVSSAYILISKLEN